MNKNYVMGHTLRTNNFFFVAFIRIKIHNTKPAMQFYCMT